MFTSISAFQATTLILLTFILIYHLLLQNRFKRLQNQFYQLRQTVESFDSHTEASFTPSSHIIDEQLQTMKLQCYQARNAVHKQTFGPHSKEMEFAPKQIPTVYEQLRSELSTETNELIEQFWVTYLQFLETHWLDSRGKLRSVFTGDETKKTGDVGQMMHAADRTVQQLDIFLSELSFMQSDQM
ncbi:hypothetical protein [Texcoconibacillus texcoconensis]|uniref:Uncharacterized protein n=1 Tax=Texcoconibacillus texcoconensis TaxID=1095777 RepID=A0A840QNL3_9BACI|nr:hypothetical protein [Texcoconibacillus texcoconensis]MBB5172964.1 hypothetical protein [Texcoconibacillus texcoconensis]